MSVFQVVIWTGTHLVARLVFLVSTSLSDITDELKPKAPPQPPRSHPHPREMSLRSPLRSPQPKSYFPPLTLR